MIAFERREWGDFYGWVKGFARRRARRGRGTRRPGRRFGAGSRRRSTRRGSARASRRARSGRSTSRRRSSGSPKRLERRAVATGTGRSASGAIARAGEAAPGRVRPAPQRARRLSGARDGRPRPRDRGGAEKELPLGRSCGPIRPNEMATLAKRRRYAANVWAFVSEDPRESNTEGGVFPAIFGTVLMVLLMSVVVDAARRPDGLLPARVREAGPVVSACGSP